MSAVPIPSFGRLSSRSNLKAVNGGRRRDAAAQDVDPAAEDQELSSYLKALAPENDPESTGSGRRFGDAQVYQLRMTHLAGQQLRDLAAERGTSPQALAQEWVLERLAWEAQAASQRDPQQSAGRQYPEAGYPAPEGADPQTDEYVFDRSGWERPTGGRLH